MRKRGKRLYSYAHWLEGELLDRKTKHENRDVNLAENTHVEKEREKAMKKMIAAQVTLKPTTDALKKAQESLKFANQAQAGGREGRK